VRSPATAVVGLLGHCYFTSVIAEGYAVFANRASAAQTSETKQQRVREESPSSVAA
jgi:hypothetical protein